MQLLRSGFMVWVFGLREPMGRNYAQLFVWAAISGVDLDRRRRSSTTRTRGLRSGPAPPCESGMPFSATACRASNRYRSNAGRSAAHLAERCQLLLMIAFGESFLRIGEASPQEHIAVSVVVAFSSASC